MFGKKKKRIQELEETVEKLEEEVESLEEEKESYKNRFESSEEKRKKLAREKQEREEKINKLEDKLDTYSNKTEETDKDDETLDKFRKIDFDDALELIKLLDSVEINEERLISINCSGNLTSLSDYKGLKNTLKAENFRKLPKKGNYIYFSNNNVLNVVLKVRKLFNPDWTSNTVFETRKILEFIEEEKVWILASSGDSKVVKEKNGDCEVLETFKERVDRKHSKGGFSQGRFEKKREEQIRQHLEKVESFVEDLDCENVYLLSDRRHDDFFDNCQYVGGFEESEDLVDSIYNFRVRSFNPF